LKLFHVRYFVREKRRMCGQVLEEIEREVWKEFRVRNIECDGMGIYIRRWPRLAGFQQPGARRTLLIFILPNRQPKSLRFSTWQPQYTSKAEPTSSRIKFAYVSKPRNPGSQKWSLKFEFEKVRESSEKVWESSEKVRDSSKKNDIQKPSGWHSSGGATADQWNLPGVMHPTHFETWNKLRSVDCS
jgi:hypothetical protein